MYAIVVMTVLTVLFGIAIVLEVRGSEPGGPCDEDTVPGDCVPITTCPQIIIAIRQNKTVLKPCHMDSSIALSFVCCPNGKPPKPKVTEMKAPIQVNNRASEVPQAARISLQKCYEYAKLVYTKQPSYALIDQYVDVDNCVKSAEGLIVNGEAAKLGEFPHMALLGYGQNKENLDFFCGGSLVSERYVLTAAHCGGNGPPSYVLLGEFVIGDDEDGAKPQIIKVEEFIKHPKYKEQIHYFDIALIKLSRKAELNAFVRPVCLHSNQTYDNASMTATGWGRTDFYDNYTSDVLMKVSLNSVPNAICNRTHKDFVKLAQGFLPEQQLCAGRLEGGRDTCQGDSGGPLQVLLIKPHCSYLIVGITSFGKGCALRNTPGVYSRVEYFLDWIENIVWPQTNNNSTFTDLNVHNATVNNRTVGSATKDEAAGNNTSNHNTPLNNTAVNNATNAAVNSSLVNNIAIVNSATVNKTDVNNIGGNNVKVHTAADDSAADPNIAANNASVHSNTIVRPKTFVVHKT